MDQCNSVERKLSVLYDHWEKGMEYEKEADHSKMFRMGFPEQYLYNGKPLLMYVGQEVRDSKNSIEWSNNKEKYSGKDQIWVRNYTNLQLLDIPMEGEKKNNSLFWQFARQLRDMGYNVVWNNLDKFHQPKSGPIPAEEAKKLNASYGVERTSILQREIESVKPDIIIFAIGPSWKYVVSLASALQLDASILWEVRPQDDNLLSDITNLLSIPSTRIFWTYHPNGLHWKGKDKKRILDQIIKNTLKP